MQKFLRDTEVAARLNVSRVCVWRWAREGKMPRPVKLADKVTRWPIETLEKWEAEKLNTATQ